MLQIYASFLWSFIEIENKDKTASLPQPKREEEVLDQGMYGYFCKQTYKSIPFSGSQIIKSWDILGLFVSASNPIIDVCM